MISDVRTGRSSGRKRPLWMTKSLYKKLRREWKTEPSRKRSKTTSDARLSDRNDLGVHKHVSGQKSNRQVQKEMEKELGRPVTIAEVFIKTHTKADGSFVDQRAEKFSKTYEKNLQEKLSQVKMDLQENSDGTFHPPQLSPDESNAVFLQVDYYGWFKKEKKQKEKKEVDSDAPLSLSTNPKDDLLTQILGQDNPGRLRAMGRGMSMTKLACFQVKSKCMNQMQDRQYELQKRVQELEGVIAKMHNHKQDAEVGENSGPKSVNKRNHPKCVFLDWNGGCDDVAKGRILSSDPEDFVNNIQLRPKCVKVLVEISLKPDAFLWHPAPNMSTVEEALGEMIAWPTDNCVVLENEPELEDIVPKAVGRLENPNHWLMNFL